MSLSSPETGLETNFLNLKSRNFENISFCQLTFKYMFDILLLIDLFTSLIELKSIH